MVVPTNSSFPGERASQLGCYSQQPREGSVDSYGAFSTRRELSQGCGQIGSRLEKKKGIYL